MQHFPKAPDIAICVFNSFLFYTAMEHCDVPRNKKYVVVAKDLENIARESHCFWYRCWFTSSPILRLTFGQVVTSELN